MYAIDTPKSRLGRLLNHPWLRHFGVISYSLYLWQQIFTVGRPPFPLAINLVLIVVCAEASYWLIERSCLKLRDRVTPQKTRLADAVQREDVFA